MPVIRHPGQLPLRRGPGWTSQTWADAMTFGEPVPIQVRRYRLESAVTAPGVRLAGGEAFAYVISGSGHARLAADEFALSRESMLWAAACESMSLHAGPHGLDTLVAEPRAGARMPGQAPSPPGTPAPAGLAARKVFAAAELPHLVSTRDTRDRLDLVTDEVGVGAALIRADRIIYHPGDTAAAHYHTDCHHVFCVLAGSGLLHGGDQPLRLAAGDSALVGPGEVHWFANDGQQEFSFVEFWAPPPSSTVWTVLDDRCTWAPKHDA